MYFKKFIERLPQIKPPAISKQEVFDQCDEIKTNVSESAKNKIPRTTVTFCINASKPRGFCLLNKSVAPPESAVEALSFLAGCIITAITISTDTIISSTNNKLYKILASLKNSIFTLM